MKQKLWLIEALISSVCLDGYLAFSNRTAGQPDWNPLRFAVIWGVMGGVFYFHTAQSNGDPAYGRTLFLGKSSTARRSYQYDYLRVYAAVSVICVHTLNDAAASLTPGTFQWNICTSLAYLFLTCNLIYVMISGALLLVMKDEGLFAFYWKRFVKTVVPLLAYYLIYAAVHGGIQNLYPASLPRLLSGMLAGPPDGAPHFWLIYVILSLYLTVPFIRFMLFHMPDKLMKALIVLFLVFQAASAYLPLIQMSLGMEFMLGAWEGVFILGYFLSQPAGKNWRVPMVLLGVVSAVITVIGVCTRPDYQSLFSNTVPTMTFMAGGIFSLADLWKGRLKRPGRLIQTLNHYSYSLILIHWYVLYYIVKDKFHLYTLDYPLLVGSVLTILATLICSYLIAWIYDNTVVFLAQSLLKRIQRLWKGLL